MRRKKPERCASSASSPEAVSGPEGTDAGGTSSVFLGRTKYKLRVGVQVSARKREVSRETVMVTAKARKKLPVTPVVEMSGRKTTMGVIVDPIRGSVSSRRAF